MNDKNLERALNNVLSEVSDICYMLTQKIEELENDLIELEKQHEQSLKEAFEKGYEEGCLKGYNDHVKLTNTLYK